MEATAMGSLITVNIDGKPLEKLIEVVSNGIGTLYRPRKIRNEADAQAYAIKVLENARALAGTDALMIEADTIERIGQRLVAQEIRRQNNIDSVVEAAAAELRGKQVSEEPVPEDWTTKFFGYVKDVSEEEMKVLWAKILAGEIERPNSFSIRTLNLMSMLSREEAEIIRKMAQYVLYDYTNHDAYILNTPKIEDIKFDDVMLLMELGLLDNASNLAIKLNKNGEDAINLLLKKKETGLFISTKQEHLYVHIYKFTRLGKEIMHLVDNAELDINYVKEHAENLVKGDPTMSVTCAPILKIVGNDVDLDEEHAYIKLGTKYKKIEE